jgi:hypothetical protein
MRCHGPNETCTMLTILVYSHSRQHQGDNGVMLAEVARSRRCRRERSLMRGAIIIGGGIRDRSLVDHGRHVATLNMASRQLS